MPNFTLKNIPEALYARLKQAAEAHRRSLNSEILVCIERTVGAQPVEVEALLARARTVRREVGGAPLTDAAVTAAKREGRA